jgi:hypothetical protein
MKPAAVDSIARRLWMLQRGAEFEGNFTAGMPYAAGVGSFMALPRDGDTGRANAAFSWRFQPKSRTSVLQTVWFKNGFVTLFDLDPKMCSPP